MPRFVSRLAVSLLLGILCGVAHPQPVEKIDEQELRAQLAREMVETRRLQALLREEAASEPADRELALMVTLAEADDLATWVAAELVRGLELWRTIRAGETPDREEALELVRYAIDPEWESDFRMATPDWKIGTGAFSLLCRDLLREADWITVDDIRATVEQGSDDFRVAASAQILLTAREDAHEELVSLANLVDEAGAVLELPDGLAYLLARQVEREPASGLELLERLEDAFAPDTRLFWMDTLAVPLWLEHLTEHDAGVFLTDWIRTLRASQDKQESE